VVDANVVGSQASCVSADGGAHGARSQPGLKRVRRQIHAAMEAVPWIAGVAAPRRDLPDQLGNWNSVVRRFLRWVQRAYSKSFSSG
jgi:hypothetical protein